MKKFAVFALALMVLLNVGCMKKRRLGTSGLQSNAFNPSEPDTVCPGGVNVFIRPIQAENNILVGQTAKFELLGSGCLNGYGVSVEGRFLPFNPGILVDVPMPQTPELGRVEEFSIVALDSSGGVHRGPYKFESVPFNLSAGTAVSLNFFPSQTISVEGNTAKFFISSNQTLAIQRVYSEEAGYLVQAPAPFTLANGEWRELSLQLSRGAGGSSGLIKFDYLVSGQTQTAQLTVNHNVCLGSFEDDFLGTGNNQALTYRCSDGSIRVPLNLAEQLTSFWQVPTGHSLKDLMHGRIDGDSKADLLFFTKMSTEPQKAYFFYGKSRPSSAAQTMGGSFSVVPCSGAWQAPPSTTIPNQFLLEPESGGVSAKVYTIQNGGARYQSLLSVGDNTCSLGNVQLAPPSTFLSVSDEEVDPGENFSVIWSASNVTGFQCRLEKKLASASTWTLVGSDNLPSSGSMVLERTETQSINATTDYRAVCKKTENGVTTTVGESVVRTVEVKACQMQASGATSSDITADGKKYRVLTFSQVGNHSLSVSGNCDNTSVLVVAGGGGGGSFGRKGAGGGGAGGLIYSDNSSFFQSGGTYNVSVGNGGGVGANGQNSSIVFQTDSSQNITAVGGGAGGNGEGLANQAGRSGGSGGGGGYKYSSRWGYRGAPGPGTPGQGNAGGTANGGNYVGGAGGGGAGGAGGNPVRLSGGRQKGGPGGSGRSINISGTSQYYAGGGAGHGEHGTNVGSAGGGGSTGGGGAANTGGGGGANASGGSGVVIIRYETP